MVKDIRSKRTTFIDESVGQGNLWVSSLAEVLRAEKLYIDSHYGSMLWDLASEIISQFFNAWRESSTVTPLTTC